MKGTVDVLWEQGMALMSEMIHAGLSLQSWEEELWLLRAPHT